MYSIRTCSQYCMKTVDVYAVMLYSMRIVYVHVCSGVVAFAIVLLRMQLCCTV